MLTYKGKQVYDIFKGDIFRVIRTRHGKPSSEASEVEYTCLDSMQSNNGFFKAKDDSGIGSYNFNTVDDDLEIISRANPKNERLAKNRPMKLMIRESTDRFINDPSNRSINRDTNDYEVTPFIKSKNFCEKINGSLNNEIEYGFYLQKSYKKEYFFVSTAKAKTQKLVAKIISYVYGVPEDDVLDIRSKNANDYKYIANKIEPAKITFKHSDKWGDYVDIEGTKSQFFASNMDKDEIEIEIVYL